MDALRYKVSNEAEPDLIQFLKVAQAQKEKNQNCDLGKYETWKKILPPDPILIKKLEEFESNEIGTVIDLCSDDEVQEMSISIKEDEDIELDNPKSCISDIAFVIKENLQTQKNLSDVTKQQLQNYVLCDLEKLFEILGQTLNSEDIYNFGNAIQTVHSQTLIFIFCHHLLIPQIKKEYSENILKLLEQYSSKYLDILVKEYAVVFEKLSEDEIITTLQYLKKFNSKLQSLLARYLIFNIEGLDDIYLTIIGALLNSELEYEALNKFVEMLSNIAENHSKDKNFGKLVLTVIEILGPKVTNLEQPLKHIIAGHKSVWKSKLDKLFSTNYEDSMIFTQSFRD